MVFVYFSQTLLERLLDCYVDSVEGAPKDKVHITIYCILISKVQAQVASPCKTTLLDNNNHQVLY